MPRKCGFWNWIVLLSWLLAGLAVYAPQPVQAQAPGENLLTNGDFEGGGATWPLQDGISEVQIAPGWRAFFVDQPPAYAAIPYPCMENPGACGYWRRPEFRDVKITEYAERVHQGTRAQKYFSFNGQHEAGLYQQVSNITPGTWLRFSAHMITWSCMASAERWNHCPTGSRSNNPAPMHTKVGIDPTGGTNPWAATVIWSPELSAIDNWTLFAVEAQAVNSTVTVFTYSRADWDDHIYRVHNDVYVDTAALVVIGETPPPAQDAPPAAVPQPVEYIPGPTATPQPDGTVVHTVRSGDTLFAIALDYKVPPEQITTLNNITTASLLAIGQELVISRPGGVPAPAPQPTAAPVEATVAPLGITPPITLPVPTQENATQVAALLAGNRLCLLAYQDANADGLHQAEEALLPGVTFTIQGLSEQWQYTTNGMQEPFCFTDLATGQYQVVAQASAGYAATIANAYMLVLNPGTQLELAMGFSQNPSEPGERAALEAPVTPETPTAKSASPLPLILGALGVVCLIGAGGVGLFVLRRN